MAKQKRNQYQQYESEMNELDFATEQEITEEFEQAWDEPNMDNLSPEPLTDKAFLYSLEAEEIASILRLNSVYREEEVSIEANGHTMKIAPEAELILDIDDEDLLDIDGGQAPKTQNADFPLPDMGESLSRSEDWRSATMVNVKRFEDQMRDVDVWIDGVRVTKQAFVQFINDNKDAIIEAVTKQYPNLMQEVDDMIKREGSLLQKLSGEQTVGEGEYRKGIYEERQRRMDATGSTVLAEEKPAQKTDTKTRKQPDKPDINELLAKATEDSNKGKLIAALAEFSQTTGHSKEFYLINKEGRGEVKVGVSISKNGKEYYTVNGDKADLKTMMALDEKYSGQISQKLKESTGRSKSKHQEVQEK